MLRLKSTPNTVPDAPPVVTLDITARDGMTPVITDLWLYTIDEAGAQIPMTGFTVPNANGAAVATNRRSARLMLPAMVNNQPSGFPAELVDHGGDDEPANGIMTGTTRGTMRQGAFIPAITGTIVVTLPAAPTTPILVVAAKEDRRYAGAALIDASGNPGPVPAGVGAAETHTRRSYARDVAPINKAVCGACHNPTHAHNTYRYKTGGDRQELLFDNYSVHSCDARLPDQAAYDLCVQDNTRASFLVEPGAPAISFLVTRSRPDEQGNFSPGVARWVGGAARYSTSIGDRRMPSATEEGSEEARIQQQVQNAPTYFDTHPDQWFIMWDWIAQGAEP